MNENDLNMRDDQILGIISPQTNPAGNTGSEIYGVIHKTAGTKDGEWAIVAINWGTDSRRGPSIGIRWFDEGKGNPTARGYPTWLIIPKSLTRGVLCGLPIDEETHLRVIEFLAGRLDPEGLREYLKKSRSDK